MSGTTVELSPVSVKYVSGREDWYARAKNQPLGALRAYFIKREDPEDAKSGLVVDLTRKVNIPYTSLEMFVIHPKATYIVK